MPRHMSTWALSTTCTAVRFLSVVDTHRHSQLNLAFLGLFSIEMEKAEEHLNKAISLYGGENAKESAHALCKLADVYLVRGGGASEDGASNGKNKAIDLLKKACDLCPKVCAHVPQI